MDDGQGTIFPPIHFLDAGVEPGPPRQPTPACAHAVIRAPLCSASSIWEA